jgi:excisionase family DNA binding protein
MVGDGSCRIEPAFRSRISLPPTRPTDEGFLTTEEVLDYLQVNLRTVYRLIKTKRIPAVRVGRQWRFKKSDIDAWLEGRGAQSESPAAPPTLPARRACVLVVDDEVSIRDLLSKTLAPGYDVATAVDAAGALLMLRANSDAYDLMISDLNMPGMDGIALVGEVKQIRADLPIIIITGFSTERSAREALNLGVDGYLIKPFSGRQVLAAAAKALGAPAA